MNNFIFENATKVFFGKGCVKEYLCCLTKGYGDTVMLAYGGSIKRNGIYDEVAGILKAVRTPSRLPCPPASSITPSRNPSGPRWISSNCGRRTAGCRTWTNCGDW